MEAGGGTRADSYMGRVAERGILGAVREAKGEQSAQRIDHLKKADMAKEAERLLNGTGWLAEPLRTPEAVAAESIDGDPARDGDTLPAFLSDDEEARDDEADEPAVIAAE